jgi:AraC family transcriptional regulator
MDCLADEISSGAEISSARPTVSPSKSAIYTWHAFCSVSRVLEILDWSKAMQASQMGQQIPREFAQGAGQVPLHVLESTYAEESSRTNLELGVTELFKAVDCALREEFDVAQICMQRAATLLRVEPRSLPSSSESTSIEHVVEPRSGSGLAPWQIRKVRTYIAENLRTTLSIGDLAALVGLSRFHFSRAFKDTFGDSPHRYVLRRRIEHAQGLMLTTKTALAEIALECGLVDQAHLGRSFRRIVGETPAAWRRARVTGG